MFKIYTGTHEFKKGYQNRANLVKDEKGDLMLIHTSFNRQKNCFCHEIKKMRKTKIHTAKPLRLNPQSLVLLRMKWVLKS